MPAAKVHRWRTAYEKARPAYPDRCEPKSGGTGAITFDEAAEE
ncbi:hypothetical protein BN6_01960 [Saccharothrix espanaensis DSM 44229]|uniref:Uncharacterized protein n=1 Tax=Saccharothrix espanaensis (strain ATCC 51144 / DSM 44229 / JCM 9112 / NBRC 15066 / NRRL 15764) TaxID=1179773 RepID=K0JRV3_SACES|nr:hypothetical protein BN6_01960 [Saccharothrix espanaensis DSM 44229]